MFRVCSEYSQSIFRVYSEYVMVCFISSSSTSSVSVFVIFQAGVPFSIENVLWLFANLHTFGALSTGPNNAIGTKIDKYQVWE